MIRLSERIHDDDTATILICHTTLITHVELPVFLITLLNGN